MATNIKNHGFIQTGNGIPTHIAIQGTLFFDLDNQLFYQNKNGISNWSYFLDSSISGVTSNTYITGSSFNNNTLLLNRNDNVILSASLTTLTGITVNGDLKSNTISATTYYNLPTYSLQTYLFISSASTISGYTQMIELSNFVSAATASQSQTVTTTPTLLATFATNVGYPNITALPIGNITAHYETQKTAGSNNYYTYFQLYKRTSGGVETLLVTSDNSSQSALNTRVQNTVSAFLPSITILNLTDRIVIKIYAVMLSASANITIYYDDSTFSRLELPITQNTVSNFVPYINATQDVDLGSNQLKAIKLSGTTLSGQTIFTETGITKILSATTITSYTLTTLNTASTESFKVLNNGRFFVNGDSATNTDFCFHQLNIGNSRILDVFNNSYSKYHLLIEDDGGNGGVTLANGALYANAYTNNVSIGVVPNTSKLRIKASSIGQDIVSISPFAGNGGVYFNDVGNHPYFYLQNSAGTATQLAFYSSGTTYFNGGNVAIGNTSASEKLHVYGNQIITGNLNVSSISSTTITASTSLTLNTIGSKLIIKSGTNASIGVVTLTAGTATVNNNIVTNNSIIMLTHQNNSGTIGIPTISSRSAGVSFTISSTSVTDTSIIGWQIIEQI